MLRNPFDNVHFAVTAAELTAMYTRKAEHCRAKAGKCETALAELARSGDLAKALAAVATNPTAERAIATVVQQGMLNVEQAKTTIAATLNAHRVEAERCDWLAKHVDASEKIVISEMEARRLLDDGEYQQAIQAMAPPFPNPKRRPFSLHAPLGEAYGEEMIESQIAALFA